MVPLILLLTRALAQEPWGEVSERPIQAEATFDAEDRSWAILAAGPDDDLHLRCRKEGEAPQRRALIGERGAVVMVTVPLPPPLRTATGWVLPRAPAFADRWAVDRPDCSFVRVRARPSPERHDKAEYDLTRRKARGRVVEAALSDPSTWLLTRPAGGFLTTRTGLSPREGQRVRVDVGAWRDTPAWETAADTPWTVVGPARVDLEARVLGPPAEVCLAVDGPVPVPSGACQLSAPVEDVVGGVPLPAAELVTWKGDPIGRAVRWSVLLPPGRHDLRLSSPTLARGRVLEVAALPVPRGPEVRVDTGGAVPALPRAVATAEDLDAVRVILFGPARWTVVREDAVSWLRPEQTPPHAVLGDEEGRMHVHLEPEPVARTCTVRFQDGSAWSTLAPGGVHAFAWAGPDAPTQGVPTFEGCVGRVRVQAGVVQHPDRRVAVPLDVVEPGRDLTLRLPPGPRTGLLLRVHAADPSVPLALEVLLPDGRRLPLHIATLSRGEPVQDASGKVWAPGADLGPLEAWLGEVPELLTIRASATAAVRLLADSVPVDQAAPAAIDLGRLPTPADIAAAPDDPSRSGLLLRRAAHRLREGDARGALADLGLAEALGAYVDEGSVRRAAAEASRRLWAPDLTWVPVDTAWIREAEVTPERLAEALRGDDLSLARALRLQHDPIRFWLAAARDQTPSPEDGPRAWIDLIARGHGDPENPVLGALVTWVSSEAVLAWRGTVGVRVPVRPRPGPEADFVEDWAEEARLPLGEGMQVRLPPASGPRTMRARCLALDGIAAVSPCEVVQRDAEGRVVASWSLPVWGSTVPLDLAPGTSTLLQALSPGRVRVELLAPEGLEAWREARRLTSSEATVDLLGPTVVDLELVLASGGVATVDVTVSGKVERTLGPLALSAEPTLVRVPVEGRRATVRVLAPAGTLLRASRLSPSTSGVDPSVHRALRAVLASGGDGLLGEGTDGPQVLTPPTPQPWPLAGPPLAGLLELRVGVGGDEDEDAEAAVTLPLRGMQRVGLISRPFAAPFWIDVRAGAHEALGRSTVAEARVAAETWWSRPMWRGAVIGELVARSAFSDEVPTALRGRIEGLVSVRPRHVVDLRLRLSLDLADRFGLWFPSILDAPPQGLLWSDYREDHRVQFTPRLEIRTFPTPWIRTVVYGALRTNDPSDPAPVDTLEAGLDVRFAFPALRASLGATLQGRLPDRDRELAYVSPGVDVELRGTLWPHEDSAFDLVGRLAWLPVFSRVTVDLGLEISFGRRPGLAERRPSTYDAAFAAAWSEPDRFTAIPMDR